MGSRDRDNPSDSREKLAGRDPKPLVPERELPVVARLMVEIEVKNRQLTSLAQVTSGIDDFDRKIAELQQAITFFESKLPQEKEVDTILKEVWQMAERNQLQTKTVRTLKSEKNNGYSEQPIEMSLAGDFKGFEEASRALFADDRRRFGELIAGWPDDVRDHIVALAFGDRDDP